MSERRKRQKIENIDAITKFEELPNELMLICFRYLNFCHLYEAFFSLNQRFNTLILFYPEIYLDFGCIPIEKFFTFCCQLNQITATSQNYPVSIRVNNNQRFSLIFEDDLFTNEFSRIKSLKITNIDSSILSTIIFSERTNLCETLERLTYQQEIKSTEDITNFYNDLISSKMKSLKYLHLNLSSEPSYPYGNPFGDNDLEDEEHLFILSFLRNHKTLSNLETIVLGDIPDKYSTSTKTKTTLAFFSMIETLLPSVPKLKILYIASIYFNDKDYRNFYREKSKTIIDSLVPVNLKLVNLWIDENDNTKKNRKLLKDFFGFNKYSNTTTIKKFTINNKQILKNND